VTALLQGVHVLAAAILAGAVVFLAGVLPRGAPSESISAALEAALTLRRLAAWSLAVSVAAAALCLWGVAAGMSGLGPFDSGIGPAIARVVEDTSFGRVWLWRMAAAGFIGLWLESRGPAPPGRPAIAAAVVAAGYLASIAAAGHAAAAPLAGVEIPVLALHIAAAGIWFGTVVALRIALAAPAARKDARFCAVATRRAGTLALVAVIALAAGGALSGASRIPPPEVFAGTQYVELIVAKSLLFAAALGLAAVNRWHVLPKVEAGAARHFDAPDPQRILARNVTIEIILLAGAMAVAGFLAATPPPMR
jgi:putative copper export protein